MVRAKSGREPADAVSGTAPVDRPSASAELLWTAAIVLLLTVLYALIAPRSIQAGDAGELATVMLEGGIPHPSGYPWMRILGGPARLSRTLGLPPAMAAALPCALLGAGAFALQFRLCARLGATQGALVVIGVIALSPLVLVHVADSEVWGPHLFFCAGFVLAALGRPEPSPLMLGVLLGIAVSHHLSAVLLVPLAIGAAWPRTPVTEGGPAPLLRNGALGLLGSAIGLVPYVTLAIGDGGAWRWGDTRSAEGLAHHVSRADYGVVALSLHTEEVATWDVLARCWSSLAEVVTVGAMPHALAFVAIMVALVVLAPRPEGIAPAAWIGLWASLATTTALFPGLQNIDPSSPFGTWILERFDLLPLWLWGIPMALALQRVAHLELRPALRLGLGAAASLLALSQLLQALAGGLPRDERGVERYAVDLLRTPIIYDSSRPPLVFGTDDHRTFPVLYAAEVLDEGPGLYVDASLLALPWYRERLRGRFPELPDEDKPLRMMGAIWADPLLRDTPIYITHPFSRPAARDLRLVPEGILWRVIPPHADPEAFAAQAAVERHLAALERYDTRAEDFAGRHHPKRHPWSVDLWFAYVDRSAAMVNMLRARGDARNAARVERAFEDAFGVPLADPG